MFVGDRESLARESAKERPQPSERRARIVATVDAGRDASDDLAAELGTPEGVAWATETIVQGMCRPHLAFAERLAVTFARLRHGIDGAEAAAKAPQPPLSLHKLEHDLLQLNLLGRERSKRVDTSNLAAAYTEEIERLRAFHPEARVPIDPNRSDPVSKYYGRIMYVEPAPRHKEALSSSWSRSQIEREYRESQHGIVVVDDFLTDAALESLRRFCALSTVWHGNRYAYGRLGAFFVSGFSCPLLSQIAEDVRNQLTSIIGPQHELKQLWGFKFPPQLPGKGTLHADFAAINVNFWISPTDANRDDSTGGLVIYEADAPADWDFDLYNARPELIREFLSRHCIRARYIPYKQNRAIIFNSDLFHKTAEVEFVEDYEMRRVNITMLFGDRGADSHHANVSLRAIGATGSSLWRSARALPWRRRP